MFSRIAPRLAASLIPKTLSSSVTSRLLPAVVAPGSRLYSDSHGLDKKAIEERVLAVLRGFGKVDPTKIAPSARFIEDLGLDSLDAVEVTMAIEDEFNIELSDDEAEKILSVPIAVEAVAKQ
ncbi:NADH dehydrogenase 1, alpha/beta subcomplex subunit 1 ndufab1/ACP [Gonapodya sp. JEL0774]|nr:NADH dehydrogenase 1, alpha/beta subcomplex subunit 1 ndufab1/ACP [Gonapodya sp. JEL0774]